MEWMDRYRRIGGWLWVGGGLIFMAIAALGWSVTPGPVTWLLVAISTGLAVVLAVAPRSRLAIIAGWITAIALAADFAGAVLDRFGILGPPGASGVSWGSWTAFEDYTATLLHHPPDLLVTLAATGATAVEVGLAVLLVSGRQRRWVGKLTAGLFVIYTLAMALSSERADVAHYAMPILIGGALLLSSVSPRPDPRIAAAEPPLARQQS